MERDGKNLGDADRELVGAGVAGGAPERADGAGARRAADRPSGRLDTRGRTVITPRGFPLYL
jgi:hypothetical protein